MNAVICLPTYNEIENIGPIVTAIFEQQQRIPSHELHLLVIDDDSPDGTGAAVTRLQQSYDRLHLITGTKEGLGVAYKRGFKHAIEELDADIVMEMDADFSHDPKDLPRLLAGLDEGADFIIGSRYVPGGSIPESWGLFRKLNSRGGNMFARFIAGIKGVKDCTAGFRVIRTSVLQRIDFMDLSVKGYAFQIALLDRAINAGARVLEVPVDFIDRTYGETKLGLRDIVEFMMNCWWIRFEKSKTFLKFAIVGASGVAVNLGLFTLFYNFLGMNKFLASPIAIEGSIISNFLFNNFWTFRSRTNEDKLHVKGLKFNLVSFLSLGISYGTFGLLQLSVPGMMPQLAQAIGIVPATIVNYLMNTYWTFKDRDR